MRPYGTLWHRKYLSTLVQVIAFHLLGAKSLPESMLAHCQLDPQEKHKKGRDLMHKSHNAPVLYPTMHQFVTEMCTCVHISVIKWCIVEYLSNAM